jgi:hypothetical protein
MALVERRLAQAERMLLRRIPDLLEKIPDGDLDEADVVDIEAEAVLRVVRNPEGPQSVRVSTHPGSRRQWPPNPPWRVALAGHQSQQDV